MSNKILQTAAVGWPPYRQLGQKLGTPQLKISVLLSNTMWIELGTLQYDAKFKDGSSEQGIWNRKEMTKEFAICEVKGRKTEAER